MHARVAIADAAKDTCVVVKGLCDTSLSVPAERCKNEGAHAGQTYGGVLQESRRPFGSACRVSVVDFWWLCRLDIGFILEDVIESNMEWFVI
jgi:hypothetical protein